MPTSIRKLHFSFALFLPIALAIFIVMLPQRSYAQNTPCTLVLGVSQTCTGNQENGVLGLGTFFPTLNVNSLNGPIDLQPATGWGIQHIDAVGVTLSVYAGTVQSPITINPSGQQGVGGVSAMSFGVRGADGRDADIDDSSTDGLPGTAGGNIGINANGTIITYGVKAPGIFAHSLGGYGGQGGDAGFARNSKAGGHGGAGGSVGISGTGQITTYGAQSVGIFALSEGGNGGGGGSGSTTNSADDGRPGGKGGFAAVVTSHNIETYGVEAYGIWGKALGGVAGGGGSGGWTGTDSGDGGTGSVGGTVLIQSNGTIKTYGTDAIGIYAESIGGFGGSGGDGTSIFHSAGGSGASAGSGDSVTVTNNGTIETYGGRAHGIFAQSVGGGGGKGGSGGGAISSLGGSGSTGGNGGLVTVTNNGSITATGSGARGIYAQSLGGGGGDGGNSSGIAAIGGNGSATSDGKDVKVRNNGNIFSADSAIFAQSIGGGGGNGGSSSGWFSFGGDGGSGGNAGRVTLTSHGNLTTFENNANAIFAQSLGGGGGSGGNSVAVGAFVAVAVGGNGAKGGTGNSVLVGFNPTTNFAEPVTGSLTTFGRNANGIMAQSVGGGGGNGGFAVSVAAGIEGAAALGLGGSGGGGNNAADVQVLFGNASSQIMTFNEQSNGIFAQSVGGGGGNGGMAIAAAVSNKFTATIALGGDGGTGGDGSVVIVGNASNPILGSIFTYGNRSNGILAQSVGGGGGNGGMAIAGSASVKGINFGMGGSGLGGGDAFLASVTNGAFIQTSGVDSHGLFVQSVGGGGGNGGMAIAAGIALEGSINVGVGGSSGPGGNGGAVFVRNNATSSINTWGNHSFGILAQSVGGGGGDGGFAIAGGVGKGTTAAFGIGGNGSTGGYALSTTVFNDGTITTHGETSHGLFAQSQGGGGGSGGFALAGTISTSSQLSFTMGGQGGSAGAASAVFVNNTGDITTGNNGTGKGSHGILAQSVGGGGGSGGFAGSFTALVGGGSGNAVSIGVGGDGGGGGNAALVDVTNSGRILTTAGGSVGLFAQSVGGGGGDGGFSLAFAFDKAQQGKSAALTIGGKGAGAGDGSTVKVTNTDIIQTFGDNSQGILAQSVGGGGGNGGFAASVAAGIGDEAKSLSAAIGGNGGGGGDAKDVTVTNTALIETSGDDSSAILAQSIGKGGGNGGFSFAGSMAGKSGKSMSLTIGGFGAGGGKADVVNVVSSGSTLKTFGDRSHGVEAQSIGGGGGNGGFAISAALGAGGDDPEKPSTSIALALGGIGGVGNIGGTVNVGTITNYFTSTITTTGQEAIGIFAQSVGGGGGNGGFAFAGSANINANQNGPNQNLAIAVGGDGGSANNGGLVNVFHSGAVVTSGDGSHAIQAQSLGGGGGNGGSSRAVALQLGPEQEGKKADNASMALSIGGQGDGGGDGGKVVVNHLGNLTTGGGSAHGIFAQSIGGGGGTGGDAYQGFEGQFLLRKYDRSKFHKSVKFVLGGSGGASGNGGEVEVKNNGIITTYGIDSYGVLAQSIGGGGGAGGAGALDLGIALFSAGIGGAAGTTGDGKKVSVEVSGAINTFGHGAIGIFAESVGGGGGKGGSVERGLNRLGLNIGLGFAYGNGGGNGGDGGEVSVISNAAITTHGEGATGIFAHSIGGGGGVVGETGNEDIPVLSLFNFSGSVGGTGSGAHVGVVQNGDITTTGNWADGIFAQSAGGTGTGGSVNVTLTSGDIIVSGLKSDGIFAQSLGQGGRGNITVSIDSIDSLVRGGSDGGAAVRFMDGAVNTLTNKGTLVTMQGLAGTTFVGTTGHDIIENFGTYTGSVDAGTGANRFNNRAGGWLNLGTVMNLGTEFDSFFNNSGTVTFGLFGAFQTTTLTGGVGASGNTGKWLVDIGQIGTSDRLVASGLGIYGTSTTVVDLNEISVPTGTGAYNLLTAAQGGLANSASNFKFGTLFGAMPLERTFEFKGSNNATQLTLLPSVGQFHWAGANSSSWITPFVDGVSNWTRTGGTDYIYGTPGAGADVIFSATGLTTMGADFNVNSLRFTGVGTAGQLHTLAAGNTLTIFGNGGFGLTVDPGSMPTTLSVPVVLAGDQTWVNNGAGLLLVNGTSITSAGKNLAIDGSGLTTIVAPIQLGSGSLTKAGSGLLVLAAANNYTGGTIVNGGALLGDTTSLQGNFINNALVVFDQRFTGTFAGNMAGTGVLLKQSNGLLSLTGTNSYTGGTIIGAGTLMVNTNSLPGHVLNDSQLIFNQTTNGTYAGSMTGGGFFMKQGGGALTLTGNSGFFTGNSVVTSGQLFVNGVLGGETLMMMPGTLLGGSGLITATTLQGGSALAPGNSIGTLTSMGNVTFQAGASYQIETEPYGVNDLTLAAGQLTPVGATVNVLAGGTRRYRAINRYNIFYADQEVNGTFSDVTVNLSYLNPSLQYDPKNVWLTLRRNDVDFRENGTDGNQTEVAELLNKLVATATDDLADMVNNVYDLSKPDALVALTSMTGIIHQHVSRSSLDVPRMFLAANMRRLGLVTSDGTLLPNAGLAFNSLPAAAAAPIANNNYGLWLTGIGGTTNYRGSLADPGAHVPGRGFVAGFDKTFGSALTLGISGGQSSPDVELDGASDRSETRMMQFGGYGRYAVGRSRIDGAVTFSGYDNDTTRLVTDGVRSATVTSFYRAASTSAQFEYGRPFTVAKGLVLEPQGGYQLGRVRFDGFDEDGETVLALSVPERTVLSNRVVAGSRLAKAFSAGSAKMMVEGRAAFAHDFSGIDPLHMNLQGDPLATGFDLQPTAQLRNGAVIGGGFAGQAGASLRFFADFQGELSGPVKGWSGNVGLNKTW